MWLPTIPSFSVIENTKKKKKYYQYYICLVSSKIKIQYFLYPNIAIKLQAFKLLIPLAQENTTLRFLSGLVVLYFVRNSSGDISNAEFNSFTKTNKKPYNFTNSLINYYVKHTWNIVAVGYSSCCSYFFFSTHINYQCFILDDKFFQLIIINVCNQWRGSINKTSILKKWTEIWFCLTFKF